MSAHQAVGLYLKASGCNACAISSRPSTRRGPGRERWSSLILYTRLFNAAGELRSGAATVEFAEPIDPPVGRMIASGLAASALSSLYLGKAVGTSAVTETPPARLIKSVR